MGGTLNVYIVEPEGKNPLRVEAALKDVATIKAKRKLVKEKQVQKEGKVKKVFEGGAVFQHFQTSPHPFVLEGVGSPVFTGDMGSYWNQMGGYGNYFTGQGDINPQVHHTQFGAGFTTLPTALGGEMPGGKDRFSGTAMS